jgi:predicted N-acetyltransferase YhbS
LIEVAVDAHFFEHSRPGWSIRTAGIDEAPIAITLLTDATEWIRERGLSGGWPSGQLHLSQFIAAAHRGELLLGFVGGQAVACMLLQPLDLLYWADEPPGAALYLHKLAVRRDYHGHGWALRMIERATTTARASGVPRLRLDAIATSPLPDLYERFGFCRVAGATVRTGGLDLVRMERLA